MKADLVVKNGSVVTPEATLLYAGRLALGQHPAHHHAGALFGAIKHAQQPVDPLARPIGAPGQRVGVEGAGRQRVSHRPDAGRRAVRPRLIGDIEHDHDAPPPRPAEISARPHDPRGPVLLGQRPDPLRHVAQEAGPELEVLDGNPLVRRVDQPRRQLGAHRP